MSQYSASVSDKNRLKLALVKSIILNEFHSWHHNFHDMFRLRNCLCPFPILTHCFQSYLECHLLSPAVALSRTAHISSWFHIHTQKQTFKTS
jgi:hypothetical protein